MTITLCMCAKKRKEKDGSISYLGSQGHSLHMP